MLSIKIRVLCLQLFLQLSDFFLETGYLCIVFRFDLIIHLCLLLDLGIRKIQTEGHQVQSSVPLCFNNNITDIRTWPVYHSGQC